MKRRNGWSGTVAALLATLAVATASCEHAEREAPPVAPAPSQPPTASAPTSAGNGRVIGAIGRPCAEDGRCEAPLVCVRYYGYAGEFSSCEIKCGADADCPPALRCVSITRGPGSVCRPAGAR